MDAWIDAAVTALSEVGRDFIGCGPANVVRKHDHIPGDLQGAYIPLVCPTVSFQLALLATSDGAQRLAKAMLCVPEDEELPPADVADAMGEIMNIVAGMVKNVMQPKVESLKLGLPMYIHGHVQGSNGVEIRVVDLQLGDQATHLLVLKQQSTT